MDHRWPHISRTPRLYTGPFHRSWAFHRDLPSDWCLLQHSTSPFADDSIQSGRVPQLDSVLHLDLPLAPELLASHSLSQSLAGRIDALRHAAGIMPRRFMGPGGEAVLYCYVDDLYGQQMRPEKRQAWPALRERYGNRDEPRADRGTLLPPGYLNHRGHRPRGRWAATRFTRSHIRRSPRTRRR
jgi:hypothetical protein